MSPIAPITCCPLCKGKSGFQTNIKFSATRFTGWNGENEDTDNYSVLEEKNPKCADCGKSLKDYFAKGL